MKKGHPLYGHLMALFSVFVWGTTFIATKLLLEVFKPVDILFYRFLIGYVMLWVLHPHPLKVNSTKQELLFLLSGASGVTIYFLCENFALTYTYASNVSILVATAPFLTALLSYFLARRQKSYHADASNHRSGLDLLNRNFFIGFLISMVGIVLITTNGSIALQLNPRGDFLALGASACWAVYSLSTTAVHRPGYSSVAITRRIFFYGLLTMLPALAFCGYKFNAKALMMPTSVGLLLFLGIIASGLCYITWNKALDLLGATKASVYIYLVPVVTVVFSFFILNEKLTLLSLGGCTMIVAGLLLSERK